MGSCFKRYFSSRDCCWCGLLVEPPRRCCRAVAVCISCCVLQRTHKIFEARGRGIHVKTTVVYTIYNNHGYKATFERDRAQAGSLAYPPPTSRPILPRSSLIEKRKSNKESIGFQMALRLAYSITSRHACLARTETRTQTAWPLATRNAIVQPVQSQR